MSKDTLKRIKVQFTKKDRIIRKLLSSDRRLVSVLYVEILELNSSETGTNMYVLAMLVLCPWRLEEGICSPETEPLCGFLDQTYVLCKNSRFS